MKIYTKKGDKGSTALLGGTRVSKDHIRIEAYGTVDELNAFIGLIHDQEAAKIFRPLIKDIQHSLFSIGAALSTDPQKTKVKTARLNSEDIALLETSIDQMEADLPPLKNFVLPGGHQANSLAHISRCICRRAERRVISLHAQEEVSPFILQYLNRLSDWLFVLSRTFSHNSNSAETLWLG